MKNSLSFVNSKSVSETLRQPKPGAAHPGLRDAGIQRMVGSGHFVRLDNVYQRHVGRRYFHRRGHRRDRRRRSHLHVGTTASLSNNFHQSNANLVFSGAGTNRLLLITPSLHQSGTATITVIASDAQPASTTNTFTLNVTFTNYPPVFLTTITNITNNQNSAPMSLPFAVSDIETAGSNLVITATPPQFGSNTNLVVSGIKTQPA